MAPIGVHSCGGLVGDIILKSHLLSDSQAPLAEVSESPQQLADLPAKRDPQPGAPAGAQSPRQPAGGALCQGDDL